MKVCQVLSLLSTVIVYRANVKEHFIFVKIIRSFFEANMNA